MVRASTSAARARITIRSACACSLRCRIGLSNSGSIRASRPNVFASSRSSFRLLITDSSRKDDRLDAKTLGRLARIDPELLSPIRHRSEQAQADLMVIRARAALVEARTQLVNAARGLVKSVGERLRSCDAAQLG